MFTSEASSGCLLVESASSARVVDVTNCSFSGRRAVRLRSGTCSVHGASFDVDYVVELLGVTPPQEGTQLRMNGPSLTARVRWYLLARADAGDARLTHTDTLLTSGSRVLVQSRDMTLVGGRVLIKDRGPRMFENGFAGIVGDVWRLERPPQSGIYEWICWLADSAVTQWVPLTRIQ